MAIILNNSIFLHVGRTGGHWVSDVLWQAGLIERRVFPLHVTLSDISDEPDVVARPFRFCFVRHPLEWLASVWRHEMEFGWSTSVITNAASSDDFPTFLENMLRCWPSGPCSEHVRPFTDASAFVGRTETLREDLRAALLQAGEKFDESFLQLPPVNASTNERVKLAARAPRSLLDSIMAAETDFNLRHGYAETPASLVSETVAPSFWPTLPLKGSTELEYLELAVSNGLTKTRYCYHFNNGIAIDSNQAERHTQLVMEEAITSTVNINSCAVMSEYDPYLAYMAMLHGFRRVDFVCISKTVLPLALISAINIDLRIFDHASFFSQDAEFRYDAIFLDDTLELSPAGEAELLRAADLLSPGGTLIFSALMIQRKDSASIKTLSLTTSGDIHGRRCARYSFSYISVLLNAIGLNEISQLSFQKESASNQRHEVDAQSLHDGADPEQLFGKSVIQAMRPVRHSDLIYPNVHNLWQLRFPVNLIRSPLDSLPTAIQITIATLIADIEQEKAYRISAEQGMAHRERELVATRNALAENVLDADYHRDQLKRARERLVAIEQNYESLKSRIMVLLPGWSQDEDECFVLEKTDSF
jgi:hypothetical protein